MSRLELMRKLELQARPSSVASYEHLVAISCGKRVILSDPNLKTTKETELPAPVVCLSFVRGGGPLARYVAAVCEDLVLRLLAPDLSTAHEIKLAEVGVKTPPSYVYALSRETDALVFLQVVEKIACFSYTPATRVVKGSCVQHGVYPITSLSCGGDLLVVTGGGNVEVYDLRSVADALASYSPPKTLLGVAGALKKTYEWHVDRALVSPDGRALVVWRAGEILLSTRLDENFSEPKTLGRGVDVSFSPDGSLLAVLHEDRVTVSIWEVSTQKHVTSFKLSSPAHGLCWAANGIILTLHDREVRSTNVELQRMVYESVTVPLKTCGLRLSTALREERYNILRVEGERLVLLLQLRELIASAVKWGMSLSLGELKPPGLSHIRKLVDEVRKLKGLPRETRDAIEKIYSILSRALDKRATVRDLIESAKDLISALDETIVTNPLVSSMISAFVSLMRVVCHALAARSEVGSHQ